MTRQNYNKICKNCGQEYIAHTTVSQFCSVKCRSDYYKRKIKNEPLDTEVTCKYCGKTEMVSKTKARQYVYCSQECRQKALSEKFNQKIECECPICKKHFFLKPYAYKKDKTHCCSKKCDTEYRKIRFCGENNHQYGLRGFLNSSFKDETLHRRNGHQIDLIEYHSDYPDSDSNTQIGRVKVHRYQVWKNYNKFHDVFFTIDENNIRHINKKVQIHHIDGNHENNQIDNLVPLTLKQHKAVHNLTAILAEKILKLITGVVKQGELLETPEVDNQQPSQSGNILEGSETNNRVQSDGNIDTSALLDKIKFFIDDYIVQTKNITENAYNASINELLESEIKSSEQT